MAEVQFNETTIIFDKIQLHLRLFKILNQEQICIKQSF